MTIYFLLKVMQYHVSHACPPCELYVSSCLCPSVCMPFRVYVPYIRMLLYVYVPPYICRYVRASSCLRSSVCMSLRVYASSVRMSPLCTCTYPFMCMSSNVCFSVCMSLSCACLFHMHTTLCECRSTCKSLRVYNAQDIGFRLMCVSLYKYIPTGADFTVYVST